jgi:transposase
MVAAPRSLPDLNELDPAALKALIVSQHEQLLSRDNEIEHLKLLIAKLRRIQFGRKSEKLDRQIEQLELRLDELQATQSENAAARHTPAGAAPIANVAAKRARKPLPEHLPREVRTYRPKQNACPDCGGKLKLLGEDISEILEYVPARFKVIRQVRPKLACACCERIVQARRRAARSSAAWPDRDCSRTCWCRNTAITCRCIASRKFTSAKAWSWNARH